MNERADEKPTIGDEVTYAGLLSARLVRAIQQAYTDGHIDLETYNKLYEMARKSDAQVERLARLIDEGLPRV